jgi:catalase
VSVWRHARDLLGGTIEVTGELPDQDPVVFDPTRVVDGIELSEDPILRYRPSAYAESLARRT